MPSNLFLDPILNLRLLVAATAGWQALVGADDAGEAAEAVYLYSALDDKQHPRPRVIVGPAEGRSLQRVTTTSWQMRGPLFFEFELETPDEYLGDHNAAFVWFMGHVQALIEQMAALAGSNGYLDVVAFDEAQPALPFEAPLSDGKEYWATMWEVSVIG